MIQKLKDVLVENSSVIEDFLLNTENLAMIILDKDFKISSFNHCFSQLIDTDKQISGEPIQAFLLPESRGLYSAESSGKKSVLLHFKSDDDSPISMQCHLNRINNNGYLLIGANVMLTNHAVLEKMTIMNNEMANMARDLKRTNRRLQEAQAKIRILAGVVPICMHCKKIRDDDGYWNQLEQYITEHSEAIFSHGICDDCIAQHYPEVAERTKSA